MQTTEGAGSTAAREPSLLRLVTEVKAFSRDKRFLPGINMFEAGGLERQEIRHSNFLAFLLRPHGLGGCVPKILVKARTRKCIGSTTKYPEFSIGRFHGCARDARMAWTKHLSAVAEIARRSFDGP
jgi:hypothetical protein